MNTIYINFNSLINEIVVNKTMAICSEIISQKKPDSIYFLFSSTGGSVDSGVVLYNFLRALPCEVIMHNTGAIDSIATVIFHAAEKRFACPHSSFLFHGITWTFPQSQTINHGHLKELLSVITESENKIAKILSGRCKLTEDEIRKLFLHGESKNTDFAIEKGIVQSIIEPKIPNDAQFFSMTF